VYEDIYGWRMALVSIRHRFSGSQMEMMVKGTCPGGGWNAMLDDFWEKGFLDFWGATWAHGASI
jgi:hypothetical protein